MKHYLKITSFLIAMGFCISSSSQTTLVIPLTQGSGEDAYLASGSPSTNYGNHPSIGGNTWTCTGPLCLSRGLFKFDLSSIPAGATITSASLQLFADLTWSSSPTTGGPSNAGYLSRVTSAWTENAVTWGSQPTITAVNQVVIPGSTSTAQDYTLNVTALVQDMVTNPNYGFMLKMQDEVNYYKSLMFASSDNTNSSTKAPVLKVTYNATTTVPTNTVAVSLCQGTGEDAYLASGSPSTNYGSHPSIGGNTWTCTGPLCLSRGLFKFDLASVPAGATITNASLQLYADLTWSSSPTTGGPANSGYLSRVTSSWAENTVTWGSQPTTTAVNQVTIPGSTSAAQNYTLNVTALVQDMMTNPNYGFMLKMQDEVNYYKSLMFASSDNTNSANCPKLVISYYTSTGITEAMSNKVQVNVYPVPFGDLLTIEANVEMKQAVVTDLLGNVVLEQSVGSTHVTLNSDRLSNGIYMMHVYSTDGNLILSQKIIRAR